MFGFLDVNVLCEIFFHFLHHRAWWPELALEYFDFAVTQRQRWAVVVDHLSAELVAGTGGALAEGLHGSVV